MRKSLILAAALAMSLPVAMAQSGNPGVKQDMKDVGHDTKHAATATGHDIDHGTSTAYHKTVHGTKKGYHKTVHGTKKGYHKTVHATKTGVHKVEGKPNTPYNNPPR